VSNPNRTCHLCNDLEPVDRREFLRVAAVSAGVLAVPAALTAKPEEKKTSESIVKLLYDSLDEKQRKEVCFAWDHKDKSKGLLRSRISNNWRITKPAIKSAFFSADQQQMIRDIFEGLVNPEWVTRFDKQFKDDMGGFGLRQSIALFGTPGAGKFEFVLTGRHGTMRCDGNSAEHLAFAGPIVYGHAASGYYEKHNHPDNVFWHQAKAANKVYEMLDGKQQKLALRPVAPDESELSLKGPKGKFEGIPVAELSSDQKEHVQKVLQLLIEPYRQSDRDEVVAALKAQGGLDQCRLAFYKADDLGDDGMWDNWRLEGPAFVWHWRGAPHVHVWVHVADDPKVDLNAKNDSGPLRK
jgi:hypothetical protein